MIAQAINHDKDSKTPSTHARDHMETALDSMSYRHITNLDHNFYLRRALHNHQHALPTYERNIPDTSLEGTKSALTIYCEVYIRNISPHTIMM